MKWDEFEYEYNPRRRQRGRRPKMEDIDRGVKVQNPVPGSVLDGLVLLLEACEQLDGSSMNSAAVTTPAATPTAQTLLRLDASSPDIAAFTTSTSQTLLRKPGTGRRKCRFTADSDCAVTTLPPKPEVVVHHIKADVRTVVQDPVHYSDEADVFVAKQQGRKQPYGPSLSDCVATTMLPVQHIKSGVRIVVHRPVLDSDEADVSIAKSKGRKELHGPCSHCGVTSSPQWRKGPKTSPNLCNACGIRYLRTRSLRKVSRGRKRKGRCRETEDVGDDSDISGFMDVPEPKQNPRNVKADVVATQPPRMPRGRMHHFAPWAATVLESATANAPARAVDDSEPTSSTNTAEPRLESSNHLFCTANSVVGVELASRTTFMAGSAATRIAVLAPSSAKRMRLSMNYQLGGELASAAALSPVFTTSPLVLPESGATVPSPEAHHPTPPTWIRRKPTSGPSKALFKKP